MWYWLACTHFIVSCEYQWFFKWKKNEFVGPSRRLLDVDIRFALVSYGILCRIFQSTMPRLNRAQDRWRDKDCKCINRQKEKQLNEHKEKNSLSLSLVKRTKIDVERNVCTFFSSCRRVEEKRSWQLVCMKSILDAIFFTVRQSHIPCASLTESGARAYVFALHFRRFIIH